MARRVAKGDREAAARLIDRYQEMVRSFLLRLTRRYDLADDLSQETFLRMMRYAHRYDPKYPMRTWLLTIARRLWLNHLRRGDNRTRPLEEYGMAGGDDPADLAARQDQLAFTRAAIDQALLKLTEDQRTAVILFHQQGLAVKEVAEVMEVPEGTVKSHLHRGRAALRTILGPRQTEIGL